MESRTIELEAFLEGLDEEDAAKARAAAARIDELEHAAQRIGRDDRQFMILFAVSVVLVVVATYMVFGDFQLTSGGYANITALVALLMAGSFPALVIVYSLKMKERTKIDRKQFDIIEAYFLPHDAIYLPRNQDRATGLVALTSRPGGWGRAPDLKAKRPGWYW